MSARPCMVNAAGRVTLGCGCGQRHAWRRGLRASSRAALTLCEQRTNARISTVSRRSLSFDDNRIVAIVSAISISPQRKMGKRENRGEWLIDFPPATIIPVHAV